MNSRIQKIPPPTPPPPRIWTSLDLIKWTTDYFQKKGIESPRLEAELLLAEVLGCPRIKLYVDFEKAVPAEQLAKYRDLVKRRADTRVPLQYLIGHTQFIDLKIKVTPTVLIPRPETELLAVWALERAREIADKIAPRGTGVPPVSSDATPAPSEQPKAESPESPTHGQDAPATNSEPVMTIVDLCTGSGCLALYLASKETRARVVATDLSTEALAVATENAQALNLSSRVTFHSGDLFGALPEIEKGRVDLIVSNPPYIDLAQKATLQPEVRDHEPAAALFADENGLAIIRKILEKAGEWLRPGGWLGIEFGQGQSDQCRQMAEALGFKSIEIRSDGNKLPRFVLAQRA